MLLLVAVLVGLVGLEKAAGGTRLLLEGAAADWSRERRVWTASAMRQILQGGRGGGGGRGGEGGRGGDKG